MNMIDLFLLRRSRQAQSSPLPLMCSWLTTHDSSVKPSLNYNPKFIHLHHFLFPIAHCVSHQNQSNDIISGYDSKRDVSLPGVNTKRPDTFQKIVGEFEINQLMAQESGWDRVKHMYRIKSGNFEDEGLQVLNTMWYRTALMGFCFSAIAGSLTHDKVEKSLSRTDAMRKGVMSKVLIPKEVLTNAMKDSLKLSILCLSMLHLSQTISAYKNKTSVWEFTLSSAIGFSALGITKGVYKCGVFTAGGAVLGTVLGWVVCQVLENAGLTQESRTIKRMQQRVEEMRMQLVTDEGN